MMKRLFQLTVHDQKQDRGSMNELIVRRFEPADLPAVAELFDGTLGPGFWSLDPEVEYCRIATFGGITVGAAVAALIDRLEAAPALAQPVGLVRLVAVAEAARGRGVATRLVQSVCKDCEEAGATTLASFAWVYGGSGICPLAGVLLRAGFDRQRRFDSFYASDGAPECPACGQAPCVCAADLYAKPGPKAG